MRRLWGASTFSKIGATVRRTALHSELKTLGVQQQQNVYIPTGRASSDTRGRSNAAGHLYSASLVPSIPRVSVGFFTSVSPWNGTAAHAGCSLAPSARFRCPLLFSSTAPLPPSNADPLAGGAGSSHPDSLFLWFFSPSDSHRPSLLHQPALSHLLLSSPLRSPLLPTGPHQSTYFTGIHDGRRASVQTCLPSLPQTGSPPQHQTETANAPWPA